MTSKPKSWRDLLPVHPAAELFPMMSEEELRALGEDIKKNGLREGVALLDGESPRWAQPPRGDGSGRDQTDNRQRSN
jgi:hypothetical protein